MPFTTERAHGESTANLRVSNERPEVGRYLVVRVTAVETYRHKGGGLFSRLVDPDDDTRGHADAIRDLLNARIA